MPWPLQSLTWLGTTEDGTSEGDILTVRIGTPDGVLVVMGEVEFRDRLVIVRGANIHAEGLGPNAVGIANLRVAAAFVLKRIDCDEARVEGAIRTSGANPGHFPRPLRFTR